ncbi:MAG: efflux RND transporter periplasmic adaptor subunit [Candidatus Amulumruptor caecigallinarius]|nr:efflux RND transporter periplasmic adaptor subunit [Candidatus Amulumruptor caecigallinarius]
MKNTFFYLIPAALLLIACHRGGKEEEAPVREVAVAEVVSDSVVLTKSYPGYLQAASSAEVVAEVSGRLLSRNFRPGAYVQKGQVLFIIESAKYRDAVEEASASLASAKSAHSYASTQAAAMRKAYADDAVSKMEMLQAENSMNTAAADIRSAQAQLESARIMLAKCTVRAPISGYVTIEDVTPGNYVNGAAAPVTLAKIYDNSLFHATFSIDDSHYRDMLTAKRTDAAMFNNIPLTFDQQLGHKYSADLYYEAPALSRSTGTLNLVGDVKNIDNELKDGMYVTISLPYGLQRKAMLVKDAALSTDQLGKFLYVVNDSDRVVYTPVKVGQLVNDSMRVVESGVKPGQKYVTEALLTVRNGMRVKPVQ